MKTFAIHTRIEGGKFKRNNAQIRAAVKAFEGKEVELVFKRKYKQRSNNQNAFYWGITIPFFQELIAEQWGELKSASEIHEILKAACNYTEIVNKSTGEAIRIPQSTAELSTAEWMDFEKKIEQLSMDFFNTPAPVPNEQLEIFKEK